MEHKMTEGSCARHIFLFSLPIFLGNIFQQLYNTADVVIVGRLLGKEAFASVSVAEPIMSVALFFMVGLTMGVSVLISQYYGAGNHKMVKVQYSTGLIAGTVFSLLLSAVCILLSRQMLAAVRTPPEILETTNTYLRFIFASLVFAFLYNYLASALRALGDSRTAFIFLIIASVFNISMDIVLIRHTGLGVAGAALATLLAQMLSCILCLIYIYRKGSVFALKKGEFILDISIMKKTLVFSWASALQQTFLYFGRLLVQGTINSHGTDMITGYTAAIRLEAFFMAFIDGTQAGLSTFEAQNFGAGKKDRIRKGLSRTLFMNGLAVAATAFFMYSFPQTLIGFYVTSGNTQALKLGVTYLTIMPPFYLLSGAMSAFQGFFRGVGEVRITMIATMSQILIRCVMAIILVPRMGIYGVCLSVILGWIWMSAFEGVNITRYLKRLGKDEGNA